MSSGDTSGSPVDLSHGSFQGLAAARVGGAGATHELLEYLEALNTTRHTVRYTVGWKNTDDDAYGSLPEGYFVAELTGVNTREG
ncbi:UNVERIFIED_CONTAM: hypothetical protein RKD50_000301 [Streptomyces canus]